jgi:hypothetical protein
MRAEVARQARLLIQRHQPNQLFLAVDYNEGESGGACTLLDLTRYMLDSSDNLDIPLIILDNSKFRSTLSEADAIDLKRQYHAKKIVLFEYVLFGGNLAQLKAACDEFGKGDNSHWMRWQAKLRATVFKKMAPPLAQPTERTESAPPLSNEQKMLADTIEATSELSISAVNPRMLASSTASTAQTAASAEFASSEMMQRIIQDSNHRGSLRVLRERTRVDEVYPAAQSSLSRSVTLPVTNQGLMSPSNASASPFSFGDSPSTFSPDNQPTPSPDDLAMPVSQGLVLRAQSTPTKISKEAVSWPIKFSHETLANMPPLPMLARVEMRLIMEETSHDTHAVLQDNQVSLTPVVAPQPIRSSTAPNFRQYTKLPNEMTEQETSSRGFFSHSYKHRLSIIVPENSGIESKISNERRSP